MELGRPHTYHPRVAEIQLPFHSPDLESRFREQWYRSSLRQIRISMVLAIVLLLAFAQLDVHYFSQDLIQQVFWFRWLVIAPLCVVILAATYCAVRGYYVFVLMTLTLSLMAWFFASLAQQLHGQALSYLMPLLVQLALFQLVLLRIPFTLSLFGSIFALVVTAIAVYSIAIPLHQRYSVIGGFAAIHLILLFSAHQREAQQRALFMREQQLRQSMADREHIQDERATWYQNLAQFLRHELSNQLVGARTSLQLVERFAERRNEYLSRACQSLDRMQLMLNETSDASSVEEALKTEEREVFELSLLVAECVADYQDQHPEVTFDLQLTSNVRMNGQPFRIAQLLDKLVSNAVRHSAPGEPIRIRLQVLPDSRWAELSVINRGTPLPDDVDALFSLWATSAAYADEHRLGLGLYVAARVAEAHGGRIEAEPLREPDGARFRVTLPLAPRAV